MATNGERVHRKSGGGVRTLDSRFERFAEAELGLMVVDEEAGLNEMDAEIEISVQN